MESIHYFSVSLKDVIRKGISGFMISNQHKLYGLLSCNDGQKLQLMLLLLLLLKSFIHVNGNTKPIRGAQVCPPRKHVCK